MCRHLARWRRRCEKPDAVDRPIEKGKTKGNKVFEVVNKVKAKIPD